MASSARVICVALCAVFMLPWSSGLPTGLPMGDGPCPYLPCPYVGFCSETTHTYYWRNQTDGSKVLCQGCDQCVRHVDSSGREVARELDTHSNCEDILCAPLPPSCSVSATREPAQLVGSNGQPCPACPVCLDYIANLPQNP